MSGDVIEKAAWRSFFEGLSRVLEGQRAEVEVASLGLGHQIAAEWAPILGLSYDGKDDIISMAVGGLDHLISRPQAVSARLRGSAVESLAVTDHAGTLHIASHCCCRPRSRPEAYLHRGSGPDGGPFDLPSASDRLLNSRSSARRPSNKLDFEGSNFHYP